jgi:predicted dehydrogenase
LSNKQKLNVACIGAGYFSQFHFAAWRRIEEVNLVAVMDKEIDRAREISLRAYDDLDAMLSDNHVDVLDIISPPPTHLDCIRAAIRSNVPLIICQKPFCGDLATAKIAVQEAEKSASTLVVHENFRFQPWYRCIRSAIEQGEIGELQQLTFRLRPGDGQGPEAYLDRQPYFQTMPRFLIHETGIHWIDTFRYLCGEPIGVYADLRQMNKVIAGEDAGYFVLSFPENKRALFDANRLLDHDADNTRCTMGEALVEGTEGVIQLDGDGRVRIRKIGQRNYTVLLKAQEWQGFGGDCVYGLQRHVVDSVLQKGMLENRAEEYIRNMEIEESIYKSAKLGRRIPLGL